MVATWACTTGGPGRTPRPVIAIGVDLPLSGAEARAAQPALFGIKFYVGRHPTIDGFDVTLRVFDDRGDPAGGAASVSSFLADRTVLGMIGPYDAAVARQEIPVANAAGLAMVSPATSNPCLTRDVYTPAALNPARTAITCKDAGLPSARELRPAKVNNFFRMSATDELQGAAAADYAFRSLNLLRVAVVTDHEAYGQGLALAFSSRFTSLGGTVLGRLDLEPKNPSATGFLKTMHEAGAQAVYYGGGSQPGCAIRAQMDGIFPGGEATPFLGGDGIAEDPACISAAGGDAEGIFATVPIVDADSRPQAVPTIHDFKAAFAGAADYGPYTIIAYDATAVLYAAIAQAVKAAAGARPERSAVTAQVATTSGLEGVTGNLGFDPAGDTTNRVVSVFESSGPDPRARWTLAEAVDYSAKLPY